MHKTNEKGTNINNIQLLSNIALPLVNKFYKANKARGKAKGNDRVYVIRDKSEIVGAARVVDISGHDFLTTVQVGELYQRQGIATQLISHICKMQSKPLFTFPYQHLMALYLRLGFEEVEAEQLPKPLLQRFGRYQTQGRDITGAVYNLM